MAREIKKIKEKENPGKDSLKPWVAIAAIVATVFCVIALLWSWRLSDRLASLKDQKESVERALQVEQERFSSLEDALDHKLTEEDVRKIAREKLGLADPDDVLLVPIIR